MAARTSRRPHRPGRKLLRHDRSLDVQLLGGVDEAGRGALAGPLVAASVILDIHAIVGPEAAPLGRLDDSKKVAPELRERLYSTVLSLARCISVVVVDPATIDRDGLHVCNLEAMRRCIDAMSVRAELVLVDGFEVRETASGVPTRRIVKGDATSAAIAAAAIVAKVTRDRLMHRIDADLGGRWAFAEHVGYATPLHAERIREHGITRLHRRSYDARSYKGAPDALLATLGAPTLAPA